MSTSPTALTLLLVLAAEPDKEYALLDLAKAARVPAGSVYRYLEELERIGWLSQRREDQQSGRVASRRLYRITEAGVAAAGAMEVEEDGHG